MKIDTTDFINTNYLQYANYVLSSRAIPSVIDGFKPSQRKVIYTALKHAHTNRVKTAALSGMVVAYAGYHHGSASLDGAISLMTPLWKNNIPLFDGEGNFGSRLINDAAAARYTFVKLHKNFIENFTDLDLVEYYENLDPEAPEPKYYLPLIPWVLLQGIKGIAVGYATEIQPYNIKDIKSLCIEYLKGNNIDNKNILPYFNSSSGKVYKNALGVFIDGNVEIKNSSNITITELPTNYQREQYINILDKLEQDHKIVSYVDKCSGGKFKFDIKFKRGMVTTKPKLMKLLKLTSKLNENLTTIDENGKLKIFHNKMEIIKYFCDWRLKQFEVRYDHYIKRDTLKLNSTELKLKYIDAVNENKIIFKNKTKPELNDLVVDVLKTDKDSANILTAMPMYNLTIGHRSDLINIKDKLVKNIKIWSNINCKDQYIKELKFGATQ